MKNKLSGKRLLTLVLTAAMLLGLTAMPAARADVRAEGTVESPVIVKNGDGTYDVTFAYEGDADSVGVRGTVPGTNWDSDAVAMTNTDGVWSAKVQGIPGGSYEYKFVLDNGRDWPTDPGNVLYADNGNSLLYLDEKPLVQKEPFDDGYRVTFSYADTAGTAETVKLMSGNIPGGSWDPDKSLKLAKADGANLWRLTLYKVPAGKYEYKYLINGGDWKEDPANPNGGSNSQLTVGEAAAPEYVSPEIKGGDVTFRYKDDSATSVELMGTVPGADWDTNGTPALTKNAESGLWEITVKDIPAGKYQYKFYVNESDWVKDPANDWVEGDNNIFAIAGLAAPAALTVKTGETLELPAKLSLFGDDGNSSEVSVTYELKGEYAGVTLAEGKLTVPADFKGDSIVLTAKNGENSIEIAVKVVSTVYTYVIHFFDWDETHMNVDAADMHVWEVGGGDIGDLPFETTETIDGRTWLKGTVTTAATSIGVIPRSKGAWTWKTVDHMINNAEKAETLDVYIVMGDDTTYINETPDLPEEQGRSFYVPGTFPGPSWDAGSNKMEYDEALDIYYFIFRDVPAANYEFKIAVNASWNENYGVGGQPDGSNYSLSVPETMNVIVYYSDVTHLAVTNLNYEFVDVSVSGTGVAETKLTDAGLTGIYMGKAHLEAGTYSDVKLAGESGQIGTFDEFTLTEAKDVTFYYAPVYGVWYCDAFPWVEAEVYFNTRDAEYKSIYGAVPTGTAVTFTVDADQAVTGISMVLSGKDEPIAFEKSGDTVDGVQKWSADVTVDKIGEYDYFFLVSQSGGVMVYCDDDGYYGEGHLTELTNVLPYDLVVYAKGYETPDWMKNAVIYQIFPDRFFDGDETNNNAQTTARGAVDYEFPEWNMLPENPEQETEENMDAYTAAGAFVGDGEWSNEIYGGDLKGITEKVEYLKSIGVTVIYLNPVFSSISSHRYDTSDYEIIDPILGDLQDFEELVAAADANDMHIILDGVFNHVSDDSKYFDRYYKFLETKSYDTVGAYPYWAYVYDYMAENGADQETAEAAARTYFTENYNVTDFSYTQWFEVFNAPMEGGTADTIGQRVGKPVYSYDGWWGYDSMPIIKSTNGSEYQSGNWHEEIIDGENSVSRYWLEKGSDGWRLDVANEVSDETWQMFRKAVKETGADNVIIGEIWDDATKYLMGDMYDSVMNYMFRNAVTGFAMGGSSEQAMKDLEKLRERYPEEAFYAMMNLVDSHDTTRIVSYLDGIPDDRTDATLATAYPTYENTSELAKERQKLVAFLQFTYAGAPTIYYGDERGMAGADDPDDRRTIDWETVANPELLDWYSGLGAIRNDYEALRTGTVEPIAHSAQDSILGFVRRGETQTVIVLANNAQSEVEMSLDLSELDVDALALTDLISGTEYTAENGAVTVKVPAISGLILTADKPDSQQQPDTPVVPGGSGSSAAPAVSTTDVTEDGKTSTVTTAAPSASVSNGSAAVTVTAAMGDEIVKQAVANGSDAVVIAPRISGDVTRAEITVPGKTVRELGDKTGADIRVETPVGDVTIPNEALAELGKAGDVKIAIEKTGGTVKVDVTAGGKAVESLPMRAALELKDGEVAVLDDEDKTGTIIPKSIVEDGKTYVLLDGPAAVRVIMNSGDFEDVKSGDWFEDAVDFASSHELFNGTGAGDFEPGTDMSRAMLATVLWRLESEAEAKGAVTFPDVRTGEWYTDGVAWAGATGVITGTGAGVFEPERQVTRQEMALMIYRYAGSAGLDVTGRGSLDTFSDAADVSEWAKDATQWAVSAGILQGSGGRLDPTGTASRAEVATVLQRLVRLMVK